MLARFLSRAFPPMALSLGLVFGAGQPGFAQDAAKIDPGFREAVEKYLRVQKTPETVREQMSYSVAQQALASIAASGIEITEPMQAIVLDVARSTFGAHFGDIKTLTDIYAPIYAAYFSEKEIREITAFWESPAGRKLVEKMPDLSRDSYMKMQEASAALLSEFQTEVDERLAAAGIVLAPPPPLSAPSAEAPGPDTSK